MKGQMQTNGGRNEDDITRDKQESSTHVDIASAGYVIIFIYPSARFNTSRLEVA